VLLATYLNNILRTFLEIENSTKLYRLCSVTLIVMGIGRTKCTAA